MQPISPPQVLAKTDRWTTAAPACGVTVGNFDGVHLGHAAIVRRLVAVAGGLGIPAVALTFDPHPASIVRPGAEPVPLSTPHRRAELLSALGVDAVLVQPTDRGLVSLDAHAFYADILRGRLRALAIVEGPDFRFGAGRGGDIALLESLGRADGVRVEAVPAVAIDGQPVSSSRIRGLVAAGRVREAGGLLTQPYRLSGAVVAGARRGGPIGFPTANLSGIATLLPATGVYAARASIPGDAVAWPAAVHVGPNVSFGETAVTVEAHLIGFSGDLYGRSLDVDFLDRLRDTRRFASIDELRSQLADDVRRAAAVVRSAATDAPHPEEG